MKQAHKIISEPGICYPITDQGGGQHGGNLSWISEHFPDAPQPLIDLSTGINPYAYPLPETKSEWQQRLSDPAEVSAAHSATACYYGVDAQYVTLGAGMQPLMFALACLRFKEHGPSQVMIISPTYGEHPRVWREVGHSIVHIDSIDTISTNAVVIICNPNNPDARTIQPEALLALAQRLQAKGGWLIVDESYVDISCELSVTAQATHTTNMAVLRACGKFFGAAGLRISTAVAPLAWTQWLRTAVGPWPISTAACCMLPAMMNDHSWTLQMRSRLSQEAIAWRNILGQHFALIGHTDLFTLVKTDAAARWHSHMASQGILVRQFDHNPNWLRFGLPKMSDLERLSSALSEGLLTHP